MPPNNQSVFPELVKYYSSVVEQLTSEAKQAAILGNATVVGTDREEVYRRFLERHLPTICNVFRGGYVFDIEGNMSKQIDVIVTAGPTPRFKMSSGKQAIAPIEGAIAVAEIKSKLDKGKLHEALRIFSSIPHICETEARKAMNPQIKPPDKWWWNLPYKIIFGSDGVAKETLLGHVRKFYNNNPSIAHERRPSVIHVLGKYILMRIMPGMNVLDSDGTTAQQQPQEGEYWPLDRMGDQIAMSFMFSALQRNTFYANQMSWRYDQYINALAKEILKVPLQ